MIIVYFTLDKYPMTTNLCSELFKSSEYLTLKNSISLPNIFRALKNAAYEIRHSNFLAWILDPDETHNQGSLFLKLLLDDLGYTDFGSLTNISIKREWKNIDILIYNEQSVLIFS